MIKGAHHSCAIWIKQQAIYQIFKTTVFTTKYRIKGIIKGAHQSCAIWINQQAIYQIFKTTVFTSECMINIE